MTTSAPNNTGISLNQTNTQVQRLQALNNKILQLCDSSPLRALALAEATVEYARFSYRNAEILELQSALSAELAHTLRLLAHCRLTSGDPLAAEVPALEALQLSSKLHNEQEQIEIYTVLNQLYWRIGKYGEVIGHLFTLLALHRQNGNKAAESRTLNNIGLVYDKLGDRPAALEHLLEGLEIDRLLHDKTAESRTMNNIGILHSQMNDLQQALEHYRWCLHYAEETDDKASQSSLLNNIGIAYGRMYDYPTALEYFQRGLRIQRDINDPRGEAIFLCNIGEVYIPLEQPKEALQHLQASLDLYKSQKDSDGIARALVGFGTLYKELDDNIRAAAYLEEALKLADTISIKPLITSIHRRLYEIYRQQGDTARALDHHEQFHSVHEQVYNEANSKRIAALQTLHQIETSKKEMEIYRLKNVELAQANQKLEALNMEKNEMLGIVAHDLKNPLTSILLLSRLIHSEAEVLPNEEMCEYSNDIDTMVGRMCELIDNLLDINKIETQGLVVHRTRCDVNEIIQMVVNTHARHAESKNISITFSDHSGATGATVTTDPTLVRQIVDNILSNAIKFSPLNSAVHIRFFIDSAVCRVEIEDQGPGMTEQDRQQLFTKFARLSARPTGGEHSTGLGLSIVKKMAEALNGDIHCESAPGKGTVFIVEFPGE